MADGVTHFPSGRRVLVDAGEELIRVMSPEGRLELQVLFTKEGPVLKVEGGLQLAVPEKLSVTAKELCLRTEGDLRLEAGGEVFVEGQRIHLN